MATTYNAFKARNVMMYLALKSGARASHQVWPILYLAERRHLATTGRQLLGDIWVAMRHGPVPLRSYMDLHLWASGNAANPGNSALDSWLGWLSTRYHAGDAQGCLRPWESDCLDWALAEVAKMGSRQLQDVVRGKAWESAGMDGEMDPLLMAQESGANAATLDCILSWRGAGRLALDLP